jgi:DNA polymerase-1
MLRIRDELVGERITINYVQSRFDSKEIIDFLRDSRALGIDTESTGLNPYRPQWALRTLQFGNATTAYVVPARARRLISWICEQDIQWIGHNGPHDIRCIDRHLGYETRIVCAETYIPSHHIDSRNQQEGGIGHGLKELAMAHVDRNANKWEIALKKIFKTIEIPLPGMVYKSGPRKGQQKMRKAKLSEGWALIDPTHPIYIAYAGVDPILTYRVWRHFQYAVRQFYDLYDFDRRVSIGCDRLQRRAMAIDVAYTERLSKAYAKKAAIYRDKAAEYGCANIQSGQQLAKTLTELGVRLTDRTKNGQLKTDAAILRAVRAKALAQGESEIADFIRCVLLAKQLEKRKVAYTDHMLEEMDSEFRVHPAINSLAARTARMSVSGPPLQQLPTKNRSEEESE